MNKQLIVNHLNNEQLIELDSGVGCHLYNQSKNIIISFRYSYRCKPIEIFFNVYKPNDIILKTLNIDNVVKILVNLENSGNYILFELIIESDLVKLRIIEGIEFISKSEKNKIENYIIHLKENQY